MAKRLLTAKEIEGYKNAYNLDVTGKVVDTETGEVGDAPEYGITDYGKMGLRQFTKNVLPMIAGRAAFALGAAPAAITSPVGQIVAGTAAAVPTTMATSALQETLLNKLAGANIPIVSPAVKSFQEAAETDVGLHPVAARILGGGLSAPFAGGRIPIGKGALSFLKATPKQFAQNIGIQSGADIASQMIANKSIDPRNIDPAQFVTSALLGYAVSGRPHVGFRRFERGLLENRIPSSALERFAPEASEPLPTTKAAEAPVVKPSDEAGFSVENYKNKPDEVLKGLRGPGQVLLALRKTGIEPHLTDADYRYIVDNPTESVGKVIEDITKSKLPAITAQQEVQRVEAERLAAGSIKNQEEIARQTNLNAIKSAVEPPSDTGKSAAESAAAILERPEMVKEAKKDVAGLADHEKIIKKIDNRIKAAIKANPDDPLIDILAQARAEELATFQAKQASILPAAMQKLIVGGGSEPLSPTLPKVTKESDLPPATPLQPETPSKAEIPKAATPIPEGQAQLSAQIKELLDGKKPAVVFPPGSPIPPGTEAIVGTKLINTVAGKILYKTSGPLNINKIQNAANRGKLNELLFGKGTTKLSAEIPTLSVQTKTPEGQLATQAAATKETLPKTVEVLEKQKLPGEKVEVKPVKEGLKERVEAAKAESVVAPVIEVGDTITLGQAGTAATQWNVDAINKAGRVTLVSAATNRKAYRPMRELQAGITSIDPASGKPRIALHKQTHEVEIRQSEKPKMTPGDSAEILRRISMDKEYPSISANYKQRVRKHELYDAFRASDPANNNEVAFFKTLSPEDQARLFENRTFIKKKVEPKSTGLKIKINPQAGQVGGMRSVKGGKITFDPIMAIYKRSASNLEKISMIGPLGYHFAKRGEQAINQTLVREGPIVHRVNLAEHSLTTNEKQLVDDYIAALNHNDETFTGQLSPRLQQAAQAVLAASRETFEMSKQGPWVTITNPDGSTSYRPREQIGNFVHEDFAPWVKNTIEKGTDAAEIDRIKKVYRAHLIKEGTTPEQADSIMKSRLLSGDPIMSYKFDVPNVLYNALRKPHGYSIPKELRASYFDSVKTDARRTAKDVSFNEAFEQDPIMAKSLGFKSDGRGNPLPEIVFDRQGQLVHDDLSANRDVRKFFESFANAGDRGNQSFEAVDRLLKTGWIQAPAAGRDIMTSLAIFPEFLSPSEYHYIVEGSINAMSVGAKERAIGTGALRSSRTMNPNVAEDATDALNRIADVGQKLSGAESLNTIHRVAINEIALLKAKSTVAIRDKAFLDKWGPLDWEKWEPERLVKYLAQENAGNVTGTYDARELPGFLLPGSGAKFFRPFFSLQRWSVGRFNRWVKNAYEPAKAGKIGPLIHGLTGAFLSAGAVAWLTEQITRRKPQELTWEEYLKLGGKDTAHTVFAKLNAAAYGGAISQAAFSAIQLLTGDKPRGSSNVMIGAAEDAFGRIAQFVDDLDKGRAGIEDLGIMLTTIARDNIQDWKWLTPIEDIEGKREEHLAQRTGFLPRGQGRTSTISGSPFSISRMYKEGDTERLNKYFERTKEYTLTGAKKVQPPSSAMHKDVGINPLTGKPGLGYYNFIEATQGKEARKKALEHDRQLTMERAKLFSTSIRK